MSQIILEEIIIESKDIMLQTIEKWLLKEFYGNDPLLIQKFTDTFKEEGIVLVKDLVSLFKKPQLTYEYLKSEYGFKLGHYNRLIDSLTELVDATNE